MILERKLDDIEIDEITNELIVNSKKLRVISKAYGVENLRARINEGRLVFYIKEGVSKVIKLDSDDKKENNIKGNKYFYSHRMDDEHGFLEKLGTYSYRERETGFDYFINYLKNNGFDARFFPIKTNPDSLNNFLKNFNYEKHVPKKYVINLKKHNILGEDNDKVSFEENNGLFIINNTGLRYEK